MIVWGCLSTPITDLMLFMSKRRLANLRLPRLDQDPDLGTAHYEQMEKACKSL